jgi:hypothetical protein
MKVLRAIVSRNNQAFMLSIVNFAQKIKEYNEVHRCGIVMEGTYPIYLRIEMVQYANYLGYY